MIYKFQFKSTFVQYLLFFIPLIPIAYVFRTYINNINEIITWTLLPGFCISSYFLSSYLSKGKVKITLSENQLEFEWLKKPILTPQSNRTIDFKNIVSWKYRKEPHYDYFIIDIKKSEDLTLYRDSVWKNNRDDFGAFMAAFKSKVKDYNENVILRENQESNHKATTNDPRSLIIDREKKFHQSGWATFFFYVYILTLVFGVIGLVIKWDNLTGAQPLLIVSGLFGCMFLIGQHLKKKKE